MSLTPKFHISLRYSPFLEGKKAVQGNESGKEHDVLGKAKVSKCETKEESSGK